MKNIGLFLVMVAFIYGCERDQNDFDIVNQLTEDPVMFGKSVILHEDENFIIKTPLDSFLTGFPLFVYGYEEMQNKLVSDSVNADVLFAADYMLWSEHDQTTAYYLERGSCFILDKKENKSIGLVRIDRSVTHELTGTRYISRYYINQRFLFEMVGFAIF